jgi:alpha-ketoglutarate-dependent taurine dioxygenase
MRTSTRTGMRGEFGNPLIGHRRFLRRRTPVGKRPASQHHTISWRRYTFCQHVRRLRRTFRPNEILSQRIDRHPRRRACLAWSRTRFDDRDTVYPRYVHPVVRKHPVTGKKGLFVNAVFTTHINGIPRDESDDILALLYKHCNKSIFQVHFRWEKNSVAFWDNRCVQHIALCDYFPETQSGYRVTIEGERPI